MAMLEFAPHSAGTTQLATAQLASACPLSPRFKAAVHRPFQPAGYIAKSLLRSAPLNGKYFGVCDVKSAGRQSAGRPHISSAGLELWGRPIACPSSCAITLRMTLGNDVGGVFMLRIMTTAPFPPGRRLT